MGCGRWSISLPLSLVCSFRSLYPYYQVSTLHCQDHFLPIVIKQQQGHGAFWSLFLFSGISGYERAKQAHSCMCPYLKTTKGEKRKGRRKKKEEQKSGLSSCHLSFSDPLLWGMCTTNAVLRGVLHSNLGENTVVYKIASWLRFLSSREDAVILVFVSFFSFQDRGLLLR